MVQIIYKINRCIKQCEMHRDAVYTNNNYVEQNVWLAHVSLILSIGFNTKDNIVLRCRKMFDLWFCGNG